MKIEEYIQVKAAGSGVDPFLDYTLLAQFQTNSPYTTTFDPAITATSGEYAWDLGDGTILFNDKAVYHTYATTATRTVKLYGKGTCVVTSVEFNSDNIVGVLNLSNAAFASVTNWVLYTNASMTGVVFPSTVTATVTTLGIYSTGITGTLNLSGFTTFSSTASLQLHSNASLTGITYAGSITGTINQLHIYSTGITGTLDLSKFTRFTSSASISLFSNISMTGVTFANSTTGTINVLNIYSTGITGTLNLSGFTSFSSTATLQLHTNFSMTAVTFASSITGTISELYIYSTGITGTLDLSKFTKFTASASIQLHLNPSMTGVTFASSYTGNITYLYIHTTGITGTLDLSMFNKFTTTASIYLYANTSMTGVTFASNITGGIRLLYIYNTGITGTLDLSKFTTFSTGTPAQILLHTNPSITGITFANSIVGTIWQLYIYNTGITGTLDLSKFTTFSTGATAGSVQLNGNTSMTSVIFPASTITGFVLTLRLYSNTSLGYTDLSKLRTGVASLNWDMKDNAWSAAIVNQVLAAIDGISASGFASRVINIGGTNTDPDTTSGGFNGVAARTSLQTKTFTVSIT